MRALFDAAVAQLVERNLAKVEVESSRLFCRSNAPWGGFRKAQHTRTRGGAVWQLVGLITRRS